MPIEITRRLEIDAGHRLLKHEGKCRHVHGHRYVFDVTVTAPALDEVGRVIDFGEVKRLLGGWLDDNWDHGFILGPDDPLLFWLEEHEMKRFVLSCAPTAENIASYFFIVARELMGRAGISVAKVRVWETPNCWAEVGE